MYYSFGMFVSSDAACSSASSANANESPAHTKTRYITRKRNGMNGNEEKTIENSKNQTNEP